MPARIDPTGSILAGKSDPPGSFFCLDQFLCDRCIGWHASMTMCGAIVLDNIATDASFDDHIKDPYYIYIV